MPGAAALLGWAGTLPVIAVLAAMALGIFVGAAAEALILVYGATILAFIGGAQWGLAAANGGLGRQGQAKLLGLSVLPSLAGWLFALLGGALGAGLLAAGFLAALLIDRYVIACEAAPGWWRRLRWPLSSAMALLYAAAAVMLA